MRLLIIALLFGSGYGCNKPSSSSNDSVEDAKSSGVAEITEPVAPVEAPSVATIKFLPVLKGAFEVR